MLDFLKCHTPLGQVFAIIDNFVEAGKIGAENHFGHSDEFASGLAVYDDGAAA